MKSRKEDIPTTLFFRAQSGASEAAQDLQEKITQISLRYAGQHNIPDDEMQKFLDVMTDTLGENDTRTIDSKTTQLLMDMMSSHLFLDEPLDFLQVIAEELDNKEMALYAKTYEWVQNRGWNRNDIKDFSQQVVPVVVQSLSEPNSTPATLQNQIMEISQKQNWIGHEALAEDYVLHLNTLGLLQPERTKPTL